MQHTHPVNHGHGAFNRYVADCPACDAMRRRVAVARNEYRKARDQAARDCGLVKVRGNLGGTYYE